MHTVREARKKDFGVISVPGVIAFSQSEGI